MLGLPKAERSMKIIVPTTIWWTKSENEYNVKNIK